MRTLHFSDPPIRNEPSHYGSRKRSNAEVEIGRLNTMLCHLGNASDKLGRDVRFAEGLAV